MPSINTKAAPGHRQHSVREWWMYSHIQWGVECGDPRGARKWKIAGHVIYGLGNDKLQIDSPGRVCGNLPGTNKESPNPDRIQLYRQHRTRAKVQGHLFLCVELRMYERLRLQSEWKCGRMNDGSAYERMDPNKSGRIHRVACLCQWTHNIT